ncbi:alpha/beta fold hydrolase [Chitinimonas sp.]|uniref:alpha/beta hydrolase family protein n=1 Tax=Chitinimonas sp. TaxID=1934313 RepID=UPI0035B03B60
MQVQTLSISASDGLPLSASLFDAGPDCRGLVVINAAAGVKRRYYTDFATFLCQAGFSVLSWDARGMGDSAVLPPKHDPSRMADWGRHDLEGVLSHIAAHIEADLRRVVVIGHSAGGNLAGLAPSLPKVGGLCLIASGTCYWRLYRKREWPRMLLAWHVLMPLFLRLFGYLPAKLGVGHDLPRGIALDWRNWSLQPDYLFSDPSLQVDAYGAFNKPLLALAVADDTGFAPPPAVDDLLARFSAARIERRLLHAEQFGLRSIGHFNFFRRSHANLWPQVSEWLAITLDSRASPMEAVAKPWPPHSRQ